MAFRFMIVDDTRFMRIMLTDILQRLHYEVVGEAENGFQGVELYRELKPDIVFMDISMPEMDGIEALQRIREIDPKAVVIICSAVSQQDRIADAMKHGASGYVMKPFKPKQIKEAVDKYASIIEKTEPLTEPQNEPTTAPLTEPQNEPTTAPLTEPESEPVATLLTDLPSELAAELLTERPTEPAAEHLTERQFELPAASHHGTFAEMFATELQPELELELSSPQQTVLEDPIITWPTATSDHPIPVARLEEVYACRWSESGNGLEEEYKVSFAPGDEKLQLEVSGERHQKLEISIATLCELAAWVQARMSAKPALSMMEEHKG